MYFLYSVTLYFSFVLKFSGKYLAKLISLEFQRFKIQGSSRVPTDMCTSGQMVLSENYKITITSTIQNYERSENFFLYIATLNNFIIHLSNIKDGGKTSVFDSKSNYLPKIWAVFLKPKKALNG